MFHVPLHFTYLLIWRHLNANVLTLRMCSVQCTRSCYGTRSHSRLTKWWKNSKEGHEKLVEWYAKAKTWNMLKFTFLSFSEQFDPDSLHTSRKLSTLVLVWVLRIWCPLLSFYVWLFESFERSKTCKGVNRCWEKKNKLLTRQFFAFPWVQ